MAKSELADRFVAKMASHTIERVRGGEGWRGGQAGGQVRVIP